MEDEINVEKKSNLPIVSERRGRTSMVSWSKEQTEPWIMIFNTLCNHDSKLGFLSQSLSSTESTVPVAS